MLFAMKKTTSEYLERLNTRVDDDALFPLRTLAEKEGVPLIAAESLRFLKQIVRMIDAERVLEIGTAIGYTSLALALDAPGLHVVTIERNETMARLSRAHFAEYDVEGRITLVEGDALSIDPARIEGVFDLMFIDGAKAQSGRFLKRFEPQLRLGGVVVIDNVLFRELIGTRTASRHLNQLLRKIDTFNRELIDDPAYDTVVHPIGDGLSVAIKKR